MKKNIIITFSISIIINFLIILLSSTIAGAGAVERDELRVNAGLDYFQSILTADLDIAEKKGDDGFLTLLLIYTDNRPQAEKMTRIISSLKEIKDIPIRVEITNDLTLSSFKDKPPAGIFITQPLENKLPDVVDYAVKNSIVLFSPFKGDVEKGVLGGIHISAKVRPYINLSAMKASKVRITKIFISVSETYAP